MVVAQIQMMLYVSNLVKFFIYSCIILQTVNASSNETDRLALLDFKRSVTDDPHGSLTSWNNSVRLCDWNGISCSRKHERVTAINLPLLDLSGTISPSITNLSFLQVLDLSQNKFHDKIPYEVGSLFRLRQLYLLKNSFTGEIPVGLKNCTQLNDVDFSHNFLTGKIPPEMWSLVKLMSLRLNSNNLTGHISSGFGNLSALVVFLVNSNYMEGNIPDEIGGMQSLRHFLIANNNFTGNLPLSFFNISSLETIIVSLNRLTGTFPSNLGLALANLKIFAAGTNSFRGSIPPSIVNASKLEIIEIDRNNLSGNVPNGLGILKNLTVFHIGVNNIGTNSSDGLDFITSLTNCSFLRKLDISQSNFGGFIPESVGNLSTKLGYLNLQVNQVHGKIPSTISKLVSLYSLNLLGNLLSGEIPIELGMLQNLEGLFLDGNQLSGKIPSSIGNFTQLTMLYLGNNELEGSIPTSIGDCQGLLLLELSYNRLNGSIPQQLFTITSLSLLVNLSHNSFTGALPLDELGKLDNVIALDVSENSLSGEIPSTIGDCVDLQYLYMHGNSFEGTIPSTLSSLKNIVVLDLSSNKLTGEIPKTLLNISSLQYLNLSFNDLEGEIVGGLGINASAILLQGNSKLCSAVQDFQLPKCSSKRKKDGKSQAFILTVTVIPIFLLAVSVISFLVLKSNKPSSSSSGLPSLDKLLKVSYRSLYKATDGFSESNLIGSGGSGLVYKAVVDDDQGQRLVVAVKLLNLQHMAASKSFAAECKVLRTVRHRNLVKMLTYCCSLDNKGNEFRALVFELMGNYSLDKWLHQSSENSARCLDFVERLNIAIDVASALHYLHHLCETPIVHCDLKPSNVLLDGNMVAHLSDFGLARILSSEDADTTSTLGFRGSVGYAPPEYGMGGEPSISGDVYSYGILLLEMFTGKSPTDEMFDNNLNLHSFVERAMPEKVMDVVQPQLIPVETEESTYNDRQLIIEVKSSLISLLSIGVACSKTSSPPGGRMNMEDVNAELNLMKKGLLVAINKCRLVNGH